MTDCSTATTTPTRLRDISQVEPTEATVTDDSVFRAATDHSSKMTQAHETRAALKKHTTWPDLKCGPQQGENEETSSWPETLESFHDYDLLLTEYNVSEKWSKRQQAAWQSYIYSSCYQKFCRTAGSPDVCVQPDTGEALTTSGKVYSRRW